MATLPYLTNVDFRAGTRPAKQDGSPSLATKDDVAAWASFQPAFDMICKKEPDLFD